MIFLSTGCDDDDDGNINPGNQDIINLAQATPELSTLAQALSDYPDLVNTLSGPGSFTVFAPDNAAFQDLLGIIGQNSADDLPEEVLRDILELHVIASAALSSGDLTDGQMANTVNGEDITVSINGSTVSIDQAQVTSPDIEASNGIIHIIDAVIVPSNMLPLVNTVVAPIFFNQEFTTLVAAASAADEDLISVLIGNGPSDNGLTLFAPTNTAFEAAGITSLPDGASLSAVLKYHVLDGTVTSGDLPAGSAEISTLGGMAYLSNVTEGVFLNGSSQVVEVDITTDNGVVHVIDRALVPPTQTIAGIVSDFASATEPEFTLLLAALERADLVSFFQADGPITVFAPTDAAFNNAGFSDEAAIQAADPDDLSAILTHHVVKDEVRVFSPDLADEQTITMLNDQDVTVDLQNLAIQDAAGSDPATGLVADLLNVLATNGVIHVIDQVLIPQ